MIETIDVKRIVPTEKQYAWMFESGADLLILTGYGHGSRLTEELEPFGSEVLPRHSELAAR
jgi:hypothetical protein